MGSEEFMRGATERFSGRADYYARYRPGYPSALIGLLQKECALASSSVIADAGSGTGILSELFLKNGNPVLGIEPNEEMRRAGERWLRGYPRFKSIDAMAESTSLPDHSVDFVVAGQAFHWFDPKRARAEFSRILKPGGWVVLLWNLRRAVSSPFTEAMEQLLFTYAPEYEAVKNRVRMSSSDVLRSFFSMGYREKKFPNNQTLDFESLKGWMLSTSYSPQEGHPAFDAMIKELHRAFSAFQKNGVISLVYETTVFYGR